MNIFTNFNDSESILRALSLIKKVQKKNPSCTHVGIRHDPAIELQAPNAPKGHKSSLWSKTKQPTLQGEKPKKARKFIIGHNHFTVFE